MSENYGRNSIKLCKYLMRTSVVKRMSTHVVYFLVILSIRAKIMIKYEEKKSSEDFAKNVSWIDRGLFYAQ